VKHPYVLKWATFNKITKCIK